MKLLSRLWKSKSNLEAELTLEARRAAQRAADGMAREEIVVPDSAPILPAPESPQVEVSVEPEACAQPVELGSIEAERARALVEPLFLANEILGFQLQSEHAILLDALLDEKSTDVLVMWPRGSGKTSCIAVAIVLKLLRNPNYTVRYLTSDIGVGKLRLAQIAALFDEPSAKFAQLFPEMVGLENRRADEIIVKGRTDAALTDASVSVSTLRSLNAGSHANLMVLDDIVTKQDADSEDFRSNTHANYQHIQGVRTGRLILSGTPYHADDTLGRVFHAIDAEGPATQWRKEVRGIWQHRCTKCQHKSLFHTKAHGCRLCEKSGQACPGFEPGEKCPLIDYVKTPSGKFGWTMEEVIAFQSPTRMDARVFATQMELNASPEAGLVLPVFTPEFLDAHTNQTPGLGNFPAKFIVGDLGLRASREGADIFAGSADPDLTVLLAVVMYGNQAIPVDCIAGQWGADDLSKNITLFMQKHRFAPFWTEDIPAWPFIRSLAEQFAGTITHTKPIFRTIPNFRQPSAKLIRIGRLHTALASGRVSLYYAMPGNGELRQQLLGRNYQASGRDDFADAMAMIPVVLDNNFVGPIAADFTRSARQEDWKPNWSNLQDRIRWNRRHGFTDVGPDSDDDGLGDGYGSACM